MSELIDLSEDERTQLMEEIARTAHALKDVTACDKLNVAALGNMVAQLHVHVIARSKNDPAWPKPVWGVVPARAHEAVTLQKLLTRLRQQLSLSIP